MFSGFDIEGLPSAVWPGGETEALTRIERHLERKVSAAPLSPFFHCFHRRVTVEHFIHSSKLFLHYRFSSVMVHNWLTVNAKPASYDLNLETNFREFSLHWFLHYSFKPVPFCNNLPFNPIYSLINHLSSTPHSLPVFLSLSHSLSLSLSVFFRPGWRISSVPGWTPTHCWPARQASAHTCASAASPAAFSTSSSQTSTARSADYILEYLFFLQRFTHNWNRADVYLFTWIKTSFCN